MPISLTNIKTKLDYLQLISEIEQDIDAKYIMYLNDLKNTDIDEYFVNANMVFNNLTALKGFILSLLLKNINSHNNKG